MTNDKHKKSWQSKIKHHNKPYLGLSSEYLVTILNELDNEISMSELFEKTMKYKKSFEKYLRFFKAKGYVTRREYGRFRLYKITPKGKQFKKMLCYEGLDV